LEKIVRLARETYRPISPFKNISLGKQKNQTVGREALELGNRTNDGSLREKEAEIVLSKCTDVINLGSKQPIARKQGGYVTGRSRIGGGNSN